MMAGFCHASGGLQRKLSNRSYPPSLHLLYSLSWVNNCLLVPQVIIFPCYSVAENVLCIKLSSLCAHHQQRQCNYVDDERASRQTEAQEAPL